MQSIEIHAIKDITGATHFQELERLVWQVDDVDVVPNHVLVTAAKNGGLLLGAYAPAGPEATGGMVGAAFGWLGQGIDPADPEQKPRLKFCSHMVGVHPDWQGRHVGLRLKLAQREHLLAQGLADWMTWTYDPLYRRNGVLNLHRLGGTCSTYARNVYGELHDELNRGAPSDRCQVDWRLRSPHVLHDIEPRRPETHWNPDDLNIPPISQTDAGLDAPNEAPVEVDGRPLAVPLPDDISEIRRQDPPLGMAWRMAMRQALEAAFAGGYTMVDCVQLGEHGWRYILVREYL